MIYLDKILNKLDKILLFFILYTLIFITFFSTLSYTIPFVLALIFALILQKPTNFLISKLKVKSWVASLITTIVFFTIITILFTLGILSIGSEATQLGKSIHHYVSNNAENLQIVLDNIINNFSNSLMKIDPSIITALKNNISNYISNFLNVTLSLTSTIASFILNFISKIPYLIMVILFTLLSTYFFTKDLGDAKNKFFKFMNKKNTKFVHIVDESKKMLGNYLASYLIIILVTFLETLVGFLIFKVKYAVILSALCGVLDLLPILGIGAVYIPIVLVYFFSKNYVVSMGILVLYIIVSVIRQIIEPKIVSSSLGLHPVQVLAAIFIGLKAYGISGMFFCMFLVVFYNIFKKVDLL